MILRDLVLLYPLTLPRFGGILSLDSRVEGIVLRSLVLLCPPSLSVENTVFSCSDGGEEGVVLRGLVLLCPLPSS